jgi:dihydrofolate synthase / folylpolyglutamate synthase
VQPNATIQALLQQLMQPALPAIDLSLDRMWQLLGALGNPQQQLAPVIHVAGTNGKGSTLAFMRAIYQAAGYRVQAYTSPHLVRFHERIALSNGEVSDAVLMPALQRVVEASRKHPVTFFEATTAVAFLCFIQEKADVLLLEVGMGGRLDATNVLQHKLATVITPIGYDHQEFLGDTLAKIANEKAGIIWPETPCLLAPQALEAMAVLLARAKLCNAPVHCAKPLAFQPSLLGDHQRVNAAVAEAAVALCNHVLPVTRAHIAIGLQQAHWPARLQRLQYGFLVEAWADRGEVYLDGAHNAHAAKALALFLQQHKPVTLLLSMLARKDADGFFKEISGHVQQLLLLPMPGSSEGQSLETLAAAARYQGIQAITLCDNLTQAAAKLAQIASGTLVITGSLHFAGEILKNHG